jgi:hypothetical protein
MYRKYGMSRAHGRAGVTMYRAYDAANAQLLGMLFPRPV